MKRGLFTIAIVASLGLLLPRPVAAAELPDIDLIEESLVDAYERILFQHYEFLDPEELQRAAIQGMLEYVGDPWAESMTATEYKEFTDRLNADYAGVGITFLPDEEGHSITVIDVFAEGPAAAAGLQVDDRILAVDDEPISPTNQRTIAQKIVGKAGTTVTLLVQRGDEAPKAYPIVRAPISYPSVEGEVIEHDLGYIQISSFGDETYAEFETTLNDLAAKQVKGLIIDLRGNGGGVVLGAVQIADLLLEKGTILSMQDGGGELISIEAEPGANTAPMVLLVNEDTASAAEILSGALHGNDRATVVGMQTYGKGAMQQSFDLPDGSYLKFTTEHWFLPDGTSLNHVGLTPDVIVPNWYDQLPAAINLLAPAGVQETTVAPLLVDGLAYLPLRSALEALEAPVGWDSTEHAATATIGEQLLWAEPDTGLLRIDGAEYEGAVLLHQGRTYIEASALAEFDALTIIEKGSDLRLQLRLQVR